MNAERLRTIAEAIQRDIASTNLINAFATLIRAMQNQISSPQQPDYQTQVATDLELLRAAINQSQVENFSPAWKQVLDEIGARPLLGHELLERINQIFARNAITPAAAQAELETVFGELKQFTVHIESLAGSLRDLQVPNEDLPPGEAEVGIFIPREFVDDQLDKLGGEFEQLDRILGVMCELHTGKRDAFKVKSISSSDFTVFVQAAHDTCAFIGCILSEVLDLYKRYLEIRHLRNELEKKGVKGADLAGVNNHVDSHMNDGIEKIVSDVMKNVTAISDAGRKNELSVELKYSLKKVANRVDRGFNFEVRMSEPEALMEAHDSDAPAQFNAEQIASFKSITDAAKSLQFMHENEPPILNLSEDEPKPEKASSKPAKKS